MANDHSSFIDAHQPTPTTLASAGLKCTAEGEPRIKLNFEVPLTDELLSVCSQPIFKAARAVALVANGMLEGALSNEYKQTIEIYATPDHATPILTLTSVDLVSLRVFRPERAAGPSKDLYLIFSTTVPAPHPFGERLAGWAINHLTKTCFIKTFDVQEEIKDEKGPINEKQGTLGLVEKKARKAKDTIQ